MSRNDGPTLMVSISLNGVTYVCRSASPRVADLVRELALEGKRVAVEKNGQIVPRSRHAETMISAGDRIEVVAAVGGG
jgi:sulfur carrier protein